MQSILKDASHFVLRFDKGEEVIAGLQSFMDEQKIFACGFSGIGAASLVEIGSYNSASKAVEKHIFEEDLEITSLSGTGALLDGKSIIHAHGNLSRKDSSVVGGHVFKVVVSATCEVVLTKLEGQLNRAFNEEFNLNLLK